MKNVGMSLTALSAVIQEVVSVTISTKWHSNVIVVYNITIQWPNHYYLLTHFLCTFYFSAAMF